VQTVGASVLVVGLGLLAGCSSARYDAMNDSVEALRLPSLGTIVSDERDRGTVGDAPSRSVAVVLDEKLGDRTYEFRKGFEDRLRRAGFDRANNTSWRRKSGDTTVFLRYAVPSAGSYFEGASGRRVPPGRTGLTVDVHT
jgi:hypothetical protein